MLRGTKLTSYSNDTKIGHKIRIFKINLNKIGRDEIKKKYTTYTKCLEHIKKA